MISQEPRDGETRRMRRTAPLGVELGKSLSQSQSGARMQLMAQAMGKSRHSEKPHRGRKTRSRAMTSSQNGMPDSTHRILTPMFSRFCP